MEKVYLLSHDKLGCGSFAADNSLIKEYLKRNEVSTDDIKTADFVIVYTCAAGEEVEEEAIRLIKYAQKNKKESGEIVVTGCLPSINKWKLKNVFNGVSFSALNLRKLDETLNLKYPISSIQFCDASKKNKKYKTYNLRIGWGCSGNCSYCSIKNVFGEVKSRKIEDILEELKIAYKNRYNIFRLISNEIGAYGVDINKNFKFLINKIFNVKGNFKLALENLSPDNFNKFFSVIKKFVKNEKIIFIYSPVQSGSNKVLKLMNRQYSVRDFKECIKKIRSVSKKVMLKTELIVGFPQETEKDFLKTVRLINWLSAYGVLIKIYNFSIRPNTKAREMSGHLSSSVIKDRYKKAVQAVKANQAINEYIKEFKEKNHPKFNSELGRLIKERL